MTKRQKIDLFTVIVAAILAVLIISAAFLSQKKEPNTFYVALGDSIAAGTGAVDNSSQACGRNNSSYPHKVAKELGLQLKNIACGGAKLTEGILNVQKSNKQSQLSELISLQTPGVITLTIGVNDANWLGILNDCIVRDCGTDADRKAYDTELKEINKNLHTTFSRIQNRYKNELPDMYVTGYFQLLPSKGDLPIDVTREERDWMEKSRQDLNKTIEQAAREYPFITYVPIDFGGHELFSKEPWLRGLNEPAMLHPNNAGYEAMARQLLAAIRSDKNAP